MTIRKPETHNKLITYASSPTEVKTNGTVEFVVVQNMEGIFHRKHNIISHDYRTYICINTRHNNIMIVPKTARGDSSTISTIRLRPFKSSLLRLKMFYNNIRRSLDFTKLAAQLIFLWYREIFVQKRFYLTNHYFVWQIKNMLKYILNVSRIIYKINSALNRTSIDYINWDQWVGTDLWNKQTIYINKKNILITANYK